MSLADKLADPPAKPESLGTVDVGPDGGEFRGIKSTEPISDWSHVFRQFNLDPDEWVVADDTVRMSTWQQSARSKNGDRDKVQLYAYRASFRRRTAESRAVAEELASLIKPVRPVKAPHAQGLPMVVCLADAQMGKDGPDADTPEQMDARFESALAQVAAMVKARRPSELIIADNGDPVEGITSSAPNQIATNTLDFPEQIRKWQRRLTQTILTLAPFAGKTHIAAVPSNHGEVRNAAGKVGYGDHGLGVALTVKDAFEMLGSKLDLTFHIPATHHDVVTYVDIADTRVAFFHGHHAKRIERIPQWVADQAASLRSPMRDATICVHGHFHQPGYRESRGRCIVSCSMFDPGSAWYENLTGEYSRPSITTFSIRDKRVFDIRFVEPVEAGEI